jgi:hypothetical protein
MLTMLELAALCVLVAKIATQFFYYWLGDVMI